MTRTVANLLTNYIINDLFSDPCSIILSYKTCEIETSKKRLELALKRALAEHQELILLLLGEMKNERYL